MREIQCAPKFEDHVTAATLLAYKAIGSMMKDVGRSNVVHGYIDANYIEDSLVIVADFEELPYLLDDEFRQKLVDYILKMILALNDNQLKLT